MQDIAEHWVPLVALRPRMLVRGYRLGTLIDEGPSPRFESYASDDLAIDIAFEGGAWVIRVRPAPVRGPRPAWDGDVLAVWARCLGMPPGRMAPRSLADQLAWLGSLLPAIEAACVSSERRATRRCLRAAAAARPTPQGL